MSLNVLMVAAEAAPLAKSGGLGDMVSASSAALRQRGADVSILMPGYECAFERARAATPLGYLRDLPGGDARLWRAAMPDSDVPVLLLQMDHLYAGRGSGLYQDACGREYIDNFARFASLSAAAARIATGVRGVVRPRVVHAHDWHAGLTPLFMKLAGASAKSVFTIHNLAFQGNYPLGLAHYAGIPSGLLNASPDDAQSIEFYQSLSFMKAAIVHADRVTTVSERYAREILTARFGNRMEGVLAAHADKLTGIINGIDDEAWNPADDPALAQPYGIDDLAGKHACKKALQQSYGLQVDPFAPLVAIGSRLTEQKLADVVCEALPAALARWPRVQFAILGQGDAQIENALRKLAQEWPGRLGVHIGYDEDRAHRLHAGADILLHGSRFEPCGLTQLYAMRYGTIPVASRVGGLADTIEDCPATAADGAHAGRANGFLFTGEHASDVFHALGRALGAFAQPTLWRALQRNAMKRDSSWRVPATRYLDLYRSLTQTQAVLSAHVTRVNGTAVARKANAARPRRAHAAEVRRSA
ncbi:glycogen synthase GlgA [Paraburkholderia sp. J41]|uniref:glycogen synthase GlgA n=1 Tax=Paraburkholderia sp. J41 TaxID=2805433 RepID=UPI002AC3531E|nr:glycogen synthase GlgA [Paraburkholderia sp. J41]